MMVSGNFLFHDVRQKDLIFWFELLLQYVM